MLHLKLSVLLLFAVLNAGAQWLVLSGGGATSLFESDGRVPKRGLNGLQFYLS